MGRSQHAPSRGLGRGLESLIPGADDAVSGAGKATAELAIVEIRPNPRQPRMKRGVEDMNLGELAASIKQHGIIQPLIVTRTVGQGAPYTLVAGERRWRAAQAAGLTHVPVIIKELAPQQMLEVALIENIQRADLNALEEATAYQHLINDFGLTQEQVAERVGKNRVTVTNAVRLLRLPGQVQAALMQGSITEGHARPLLALPSAVEQLTALEAIVSQRLSVRQTEELVRRMLETPSAEPKTREAKPRWDGARQYESRLRDALGTKVSLQRSRKGGKIVIEFFSDEEFSSIYEKIVGQE